MKPPKLSDKGKPPKLSDKGKPPKPPRGMFK